MNVLVACEESQVVCKAFRARGHRAFSCDIQDCSGGHPEWHIKGDVLPLLNGNCTFMTMDGKQHEQSGRWDLIIAHPPCTYITSCGSVRMFNADHTVKSAERESKMREAVAFFKTILYSDCEKICVENPAPMKFADLPPYDQIIEPYGFGHPWKKRTCLWLKGLPPLVPTKIVKPLSCWVQIGGGKTARVRLKGAKAANNAKDRSRTFDGVAEAMADQWGDGYGQQRMDGV